MGHLTNTKLDLVDQEKSKFQEELKVVSASAEAIQEEDNEY